MGLEKRIIQTVHNTPSDKPNVGEIIIYYVYIQTFTNDPSNFLALICIQCSCSAVTQCSVTSATLNILGKKRACTSAETRHHGYCNMKSKS